MGLGVERVSFRGSHPVIETALAVAHKVAGMTRAVLIQGEAGTGKRTLAQHIHSRGPNAHRPLVTIDCGRISFLPPEDRGAAATDVIRRVEEAVGQASFEPLGTIVLAELGSSPLAWQRSLAALLRTGAGRLPGSAGGSSRIIATTSRAPESSEISVELNDALQPVTITLPPLRQRRSDVPALVEYFLERFAPAGGQPPRVNQEALVHLWQYDWPGNVRELEAVVRDLTALARHKSSIEVDDLPSHIAPANRRALHRTPVAKPAWSTAVAHLPLAS